MYKLALSGFDSNTLNGSETRIIFTGDFCPINRTEKMSLQGNYEDIYGDVLPFLREKDISITNLECPLTLNKVPINKSGPNIKASPTCIEAIKYGGFDVVTLANNHIMDYGEEGLFDTLNSCLKAGIKTVGVGKTETEASKPIYVNVKGKDIVILNFAEHEFSIATNERAGANALDPVANYFQIKEAKKNTDIVFIVVHGGNEHYPLPSPRMLETCHYFADLGATAIVGHHSHCVSGFEIYNGVPIFYSLGNFIFDHENIGLPSWSEGYFVNLTVTLDGIVTSASLVPYYQNRNKPGVHLMGENDERRLFEKVNEYSRIISDPNLLRKTWINFCDSKKIHYLSNILCLNKVQRKLIKTNLFKLLLFQENDLLKVLNLISCEAHREVLIEVLSEAAKKNKSPWKKAPA